MVRKLSLLTAACLFMSSQLFAQATRTWVSGVGDDVNPCSRTAPCKTFPGAISKTAVGGEIDALDPGGFGTVTITKSITIDGGPGAGGILAAATPGITVNISGGVVILRNLTIVGVSGATNGIDVPAVQSLTVQHCNILGFQHGITFRPAVANTLFFVSDSYITNNDPANAVGGGGILVKTAGGVATTVAITNTRFDHNNYGLRTEDGTKAVVTNSTMSNNTNAGVVAVSAATGPVDLNLTRCESSGNVTGIKADGAGGTPVFVRLSHTLVTGNGTGLLPVNGGHIVTQQTNWIQGNASAGAFTDIAGPQ